MLDKVQIFENQEFGKVRVVDQDGQPWWVLKDVCDALGLSDARRVSERLDDDELSGVKLHSGGQMRKMYAVNESGLYAVILRSDKPQARAFRKWITAEVLPSIRKHKAYITPDTLARMRDDQTVADDLIQVLSDAQKINHALVGIVDTLRPKADYYDTILQCPYAMPVTIIAKDYGMTAQGFNKLLHRLHIQYKVRKTWVLYRWHSDKGYTVSKTYLVDGERVAIHTQWTQAGRLFLYEQLKRQGILPSSQAFSGEPEQMAMQGV